MRPRLDRTSDEVSSIYSIAGGEAEYNALTRMGGRKHVLMSTSITAFDNIVDPVRCPMMQLAVAGIRAEYEKKNGFEGQMLTGKAARPQVDVFRSTS